MVGVIYVSLLLSERFNSTPLATVVESTIYPVSDISYPAVTICNYNRVNWNRVEAAKRKYIPNATENVVKQFESYLKTINRLEYGSFDEFQDIDTWDIDALEHIDLLELYRDVAYTCEEMFDSTATCWWRNKFFNCCQIFHTQRSEYGICLSFNSVTNSDGHEMFLNSSNSYPRRTSSSMDWSGLRIEITIPTSGMPPGLPTEDMGLMVIVGNPFEWPSNGYLVPAGTNTGVSVHPTYSYSTENIYHLAINERMCIFDEDIKLNHIDNASVMRLPLRLDRYYVGNCYSECRQQHMIKFCNCTIDFFYKPGNYTPCRMSGIKCLNKFDQIMNYQKPPSGNSFFSDDEPGISCNCWQECTRTEYAVEVAPNMLSEATPGKIILDVHYQRSTTVKYRTDVVFGWMDLMGK
ncbi:pickpocket protein 19-like [Culicoides brevitarsis]|uniref:pickpocket protein 19-like n=1 Tax=Culicoides brevitarsis TaxID=469753 RepID=UPI00307BD578